MRYVHSRPRSCIHWGAIDTRPAWKSKAAPTAAITGASTRSRIRAIHFSCLGTPMPTQTTSGRAALICAAIASSSSSVSGPERGRVAADDLDAGEAQAQVERELGQRALIAPAVQEDAVAAVASALAVAEHQLGAVDPVGQVLAEQVGRPDQRHAVRDGDRRALERLAHLGIALTDHHGVDGGGAHVAALAAGDHAVHDVHRLFVVRHRDRQPQHVADADVARAGQPVRRLRALRRGGREVGLGV